MVEQKMEEKSINERKGVDEEDDFVDWMSKNTSYSTEEMIDSTQGLIFAGHHTTARTLSLAFYFLARCPKAIEQMRVKLCKYRIDKLIDYVIPQGTGVIVHLAAAHLDESVFEDPYEFNPWRWETLSDTKKASFMPFGGGMRLCPGQHPELQAPEETAWAAAAWAAAEGGDPKRGNEGDRVVLQKEQGVEGVAVLSATMGLGLGDDRGRRERGNDEEDEEDNLRN
uniref:Uncharacterized protein n=1 Tax=Ananas comosus var. bracteatus TaxID=296719 RepID=A0A6V7PYX3_ANACO|nr:unnamed protein product [Ananas comosus var. bracteatus]